MASLLVAVHYIPSDGHEWAKYIQQKLLEYGVQCDLNAFTDDFKNQIHSVNVNVIFLTPDFLEYPDWKMLAVMEKQSTILVLTGVNHEDLDEAVAYHKCRQILDFYIFELLNTEESVRDFLIFTIALYEDNSSAHSKLHCSNSEPHNYKPHTSAYGDEDDEDLYDTLPSPRQINGIKDVIYKDGTLYLLLLRKPEGDLQVMLENQRTSVKHTEYAVYEIPHTEHGAQSISVIHDSEKIGECNLDIPKAEAHDAQTEVKQKVLPKTNVRETASISTQTEKVEDGDDNVDILFSKSHGDTSRESVYMNIKDVVHLPSTDTGLTRAEVRKNKLEKIRELLEDETDPMEMLCECLGVEKDTKLLDEKMTEMIRCSETLRQLSYTGKPLSFQDADLYIWPTLVHFGAQFNLLNFCEVLLTNPLMFGACLQPNKEGHTPHDIAKLHGHDNLAEHLRHFSEYVTAEKERDSGISGFSIGTPRLSAISQLPPAPHRMSDDGYQGMGKEYHEEDVYENEHCGSKHTKTSVSQYRVFSGSYEEVHDEDDTYIDMNLYPALSSPKTPPHVQDKHAKSEKEPTMMHHARSQPTGIRDIERHTIKTTDGDSDHEVEHHRKDVVSMLGIRPEQISPNEKKKSSRIKIPFLKKKLRSHSEPSLAPELLSAFAVKRTNKKHRSESERSSGTSSTASTYSNSSTKEDDEKSVELRDKKKAKKKTKGFLSKAKNRESMRITHAMADKDLQAPRLPPRRKCEIQDTF